MKQLSTTPWTLDTEAADLQTKLREGDALSAAFTGGSFASASLPSSGAKPKEVLDRGDDGTSGHLRRIREEVQDLQARQKIMEMQINELSARAALTDDRISIVSKEVGQVAVNLAKLESTVDKRLSNIESLIQANYSGKNGGYGSADNQYRHPSYGGDDGNYVGASAAASANADLSPAMRGELQRLAAFNNPGR